MSATSFVNFLNMDVTLSELRLSRNTVWSHLFAKIRLILLLVSIAAFCTSNTESRLIYRDTPVQPNIEDIPQYNKRSNAELINGLIGMDLDRLNSMGKRSSAEIHHFLDDGTNTDSTQHTSPNQFSQIGKRSNAELINGLIGMNLDRLSSMGRRRRRRR